LLLTDFGDRNLIHNVQYRDANACCRDAPLQLLHNDVPVVHVTTTLNMAKSRTRLKCLAEVIYLYVSSEVLYCSFLSTIFMFFVCKSSIRRHLPAKTASSMTSWLH